MKRVGLQSLVLRKEIRKEIWGTLIFACGLVLNTNWNLTEPTAQNHIALSLGKSEWAGSGRKLHESSLAGLWWSPGCIFWRFGVCLCSRSWPGACGREGSAKSNGSLVTWPPVKCPFLCCIVWFSYLFSGWESCYNSCFFSRSLTEFFCCGLNPCTKTRCPAWCLVVQRSTTRPEGNVSEHSQALLFWSHLGT